MPPKRRKQIVQEEEEEAPRTNRVLDFVSRHPFLTGVAASAGAAALYRGGAQLLRRQQAHQALTQPADEALPAGLTEEQVRHIVLQTMDPTVQQAAVTHTNLAALHHLMGRILTDGVKVLTPEQFAMLSDQALMETQQQMYAAQWAAYEQMQ